MSNSPKYVVGDRVLIASNDRFESGRFAEILEVIDEGYAFKYWTKIDGLAEKRWFWERELFDRRSFESGT